jgi:hypothetical protein
VPEAVLAQGDQAARRPRLVPEHLKWLLTLVVRAIRLLVQAPWVVQLSRAQVLGEQEDQAARRVWLFLGYLVQARATRVRGMRLRRIPARASEQRTQLLRPVGLVLAAAWQAVAEPVSQWARYEQELFLTLRAFVEKLAFAPALRRDRQRSGLNRRSQSYRHRFQFGRRQTRRPGR